MWAAPGGAILPRSQDVRDDRRVRPEHAAMCCLLFGAGCERAQAEPEQGLAAPTSAAAGSRALGPQASPVGGGVEPDRTVLWLGGDVLPSPSITRAATELGAGDAAAGWARMVEPLARLWRQDGDDAIVILNQEAPVAELRVANDAYEGSQAPGHRFARSPLDAPLWQPRALALAGVDVAVLANNHSLDQLRDGLAETLDALDAAGVRALGAGRAPNAREPLEAGAGSARVAVAAYFLRDQPEPPLSEGRAGIAVLDARTHDEVRELARTHDAVVVVFHVEGELYPTPGGDWIRWPRALVEDGADVVVIHGPHVVQRVERIRAGSRDGVVAWSVGNFLSGMGVYAEPGRPELAEDDKWTTPRARDGLLVRVEVTAAPQGSSARAGVQVDVLPFFVDNTRPLVEDRLAVAPMRYVVRPLAACGPSAPLDDWPAAARSATGRWLDAQRDRILAKTGLESPACRLAPGRAAGLAQLLPVP